MFVSSLLAESLKNGLSSKQSDLFPEHQLNDIEVTFLRWGVSPSKAYYIFDLKSFEGVTASSSHFFLYILNNFYVESSSSWTFFFGPIIIKNYQTKPPKPKSNNSSLIKSFKTKSVFLDTQIKSVHNGLKSLSQNFFFLMFMNM